MFKKIFAAMFLATILIFSLNSQVEAGRGIVVNIQTYLSIREEPSIYSRELARVPNGTVVGDIGGRENGFAYINYDGIYGWASLTYLRYN